MGADWRRFLVKGLLATGLSWGAARWMGFSSGRALKFALLLGAVDTFSMLTADYIVEKYMAKGPTMVASAAPKVVP